MRNQHFTGLAVLVLLCGFQAWGQDVSEQPITLSAAVATALRNNPAVREAREKVEQTETLIALAYTQLFPVVEVNGISSVRRDAINSASARFSGNSYNQYSVFLEARQPLIVPGLFYGINIPKKDQDLRKLELEIVTRDLTANVIRSFYGVLINERKLQVSLETKKIEEELLTTANKRYRIGRGQLLDVLQAKTQLALLEPLISQARNGIQVSLAELLNWMGNVDPRQVRVQGELIVLPFEKIQPSIDLKRSRLPEYERALVVESRLQDERGATLGGNWPTLYAVANIGRSTFTRSELLDVSATSWNFNLQLVIPLFSGFSSIQQRRDFASRARQLDLQTTNIAHNLAMYQIRSQKDLETAQDNFKSSEEAWDLARASQKEAKRNYVLATIDFLQYLTVQQSYLQAESSHDQAKLNYISALVNYFVGSGLDLNRLVELLGSRENSK